MFAPCLLGCPGTPWQVGRADGCSVGETVALVEVAGTSALPGSGVRAVRLVNISVSGEVRRACIRPRPPRTSMTAAAMNAAIAAIPVIVPMVPKA